MTKQLTHHFLAPSIQMDDERFIDTLIYICKHNADGAWGFIINQPLDASVGGLLSELDLFTSQTTMNTPAMNGGPVRGEAGFVLHTGLPDYKSSFAISENICLTTSKDILEDISLDRVKHYLLCMGYCNWGKGQLDQEIANGDWLAYPADLSTIFAIDAKDRLACIYDKIGIHRHMMIDHIGSA